MRAETARIDTASIAATTKRLDRNEGNSYLIGWRYYEQPSRHSLRHERSQGTTPHLVIHSGVSGILITATTPLVGLEGCWIGSPINLGITSLFSSRKQLLAIDTEWIDTGDEEEGRTPINSNQLDRLLTPPPIKRDSVGIYTKPTEHRREWSTQLEEIQRSRWKPGVVWARSWDSSIVCVV